MPGRLNCTAEMGIIKSMIPQGAGYPLRNLKGPYSDLRRGFVSPPPKGLVPRKWCASFALKHTQTITVQPSLFMKP